MERLRIFKENSANSAYYCDKTLQSNINIKKRLNFAKIQHSCEYYEFSMIKNLHEKPYEFVNIKNFEEFLMIYYERF